MYFSSVKTTRDQHTGWWRDDLRLQCGIARISYGTGVVPNSLVVVAHLSEGIPRFWLIDQVSLETFISNELEFGLRLAVEAKVLADVNGTSGIQAQAYAT